MGVGGRGVTAVGERERADVWLLLARDRTSPIANNSCPTEQSRKSGAQAGGGGKAPARCSAATWARSRPGVPELF